MSDEARPERRPGPESTLDDVRAQLVEAAVQRLEAVGVDIGLDHLKLADVIADVGVSRSTAYRSLADDELAPQAELHRLVLAQILRRTARERNLSLVSEAAAAELARQQDNLASGEPDRRRHAIRSIMRVGAEASYREVANSAERAILMAAYGALRSSGVDDWRRDELVRGEQKLATLFTELYTAMSEILGFRLKPGMNMQDFSTAIAALVEGLAMRHGISEHLDHIMRPTGPNGELEEWTLFGIGFEGIHSVYFEAIEGSE